MSIHNFVIILIWTANKQLETEISVNSLVANRTIYGGVLGRPEHLWVAFGDRATAFQKHCIWI